MSGSARRRLQGVAKEGHDAILRKVVASKLDLHGSFAPANVMDVAWIQLAISPYTIAMYFWVKHVRWHYRYNMNNFDIAECTDGTPPQKKTHPHPHTHPPTRNHHTHRPPHILHTYVPWCVRCLR